MFAHNTALSRTALYIILTGVLFLSGCSDKIDGPLHATATLGIEWEDGQPMHLFEVEELLRNKDRYFGKKVTLLMEYRGSEQPEGDVRDIVARMIKTDEDELEIYQGPDLCPHRGYTLNFFQPNGSSPYVLKALAEEYWMYRQGDIPSLKMGDEVEVTFIVGNSMADPSISYYNLIIRLDEPGV